VIGYFDSSSIVKWFFDEPYWQSARKARDTATFTSQITYPEVMSAINRAWQDDRCTKLESQAIQEDFRTIWPDFKWVLIDEILIHEAAKNEALLIHEEFQAI